MKAKQDWFSVDKDGLRALLKDRPPEFILYELLQNAWDEDDVTRVEVEVEWQRRGHTRIVITDNSPTGFRNIRDAYTVFAPSYKADHADKRGRFNLGEKLVLAMCWSARVTTTTGSVIWNEDGTREESLACTMTGSVFEADVNLAKVPAARMVKKALRCIEPQHIYTTINSVGMKRRTWVDSGRASLVTLEADDEGVMRNLYRETEIRVFDPPTGERGWIFEMGIPVVRTGDRYHVDIGQKVPLNFSRDNVTPSFLQDVRRVVLDLTSERLSKGESSAPWVSNAIEDSSINPTTLERVIDKRFGKKRVSNDVSDQEANKRCASKGYTVVTGGSLSKEAWKRVRAAGLIEPAGQVFPTPKPYAEGGKEYTPVPMADWSNGMKKLAQFSQRAALAAFGEGKRIEVRFIDEPSIWFVATYGARELTFNLSRLGHDRVSLFPYGQDDDYDAVVSTVIHELAHEFSKDHLSDKFHDACCTVGSRLLRAGSELQSWNLD